MSYSFYFYHFTQDEMNLKNENLRNPLRKRDHDIKVDMLYQFLKRQNEQVGYPVFCSKLLFVTHFCWPDCEFPPFRQLQFSVVFVAGPQLWLSISRGLHSWIIKTGPEWGTASVSTVSSCVPHWWFTQVITSNHFFYLTKLSWSYDKLPFTRNIIIILILIIISNI